MGKRASGSAAVLRTAPAYTFGGRHGQTSITGDTGPPGPGTYPINTADSTHKPSQAAGFGTSARGEAYGNGKPGPQDYSPSLRHTNRAATAAALTGRQTKDPLAPSQPGPGAYEVDHASATTHATAPAYSISHRWVPDKEAERRPPPGEYDPDYRSKSPLPTTIKGRWREPISNDADSGHAVPGPGQYPVQGNKAGGRTSPAYTMGASLRHSSPYLMTSPGPGHYESKSSPRSGPATFTKAERYFSSQYDIKPGPGTYFTQSVVKRPGGFAVNSLSKSAPALTIGVPPGSSSSGSSPGPSDYSPHDDLVRSSSPCFTFRGVNTKDHWLDYPAPGHYQPDAGHTLVHPAEAAVSITHKHPPPESYEKRPAPGEYDAGRWQPKDDKLVTMKFRHPQHVDKALSAPGPGEYKLATTLAGPKFSIGAKLKGSKPHEAMPGPADYEVHESTIGIAGLQ
eukprot:jgi/Chrzof1/1767/Cz10g20120.t1